MSEVLFEFEYSFHVFGDDDDDKNDGRCLCLIKYCAKRQSFSAKKISFKNFIIELNNYMIT
jgi:hypothetical protein